MVIISSRSACEVALDVRQPWQIREALESGLACTYCDDVIEMIDRCAKTSHHQ